MTHQFGRIMQVIAFQAGFACLVAGLDLSCNSPVVIYRTLSIVRFLPLWLVTILHHTALLQVWVPSQPHRAVEQDAGDHREEWDGHVLLLPVRAGHGDGGPLHSRHFTCRHPVVGVEECWHMCECWTVIVYNAGYSLGCCHNILGLVLRTVGVCECRTVIVHSLGCCHGMFHVVFEKCWCKCRTAIVYSAVIV